MFCLFCLNDLFKEYNCGGFAQFGVSRWVGVPIAVAWGLFVWWGVRFWGADVGSFSGMCAFAALWQVVFLGVVVSAFAF